MRRSTRRNVNWSEHNCPNHTKSSTLNKTRIPHLFIIFAVKGQSTILMIKIPTLLRYEDVCKTEYETVYDTVTEKKCETQYETEYTTEFDTVCDTVYEQKCEVRSTYTCVEQFMRYASIAKLPWHYTLVVFEKFILASFDFEKGWGLGGIGKRNQRHSFQFAFKGNLCARCDVLRSHSSTNMRGAVEGMDWIPWTLEGVAWIYVQSLGCQLSRKTSSHLYLGWHYMILYNILLYCMVLSGLNTTAIINGE